MNSMKPRAAGLDLGAVAWRKAKASGSNGACVRVAQSDSYVLVDDSKNPSPAGGPALVFTGQEFRAFLDAAKAGELDHLLG